MQAFIGLTGVKESGKTTTFEFIKELYSEVREVTLAKRLKDVCATVFEIPRNAFDDQSLKEKELQKPIYLHSSNVEAVIKSFGYTPHFDNHVRQHIGVVLETPRRVAQYIGTEVLRNVDTDIHCVGSIMDLPENGLFVVTDMRFPSEFSFFKNRFPLFYPVYISNYGAESKVGPNSHESERHVLEIAKVCERIDNNSTKAELKAKVQTLLQSILGRVEAERLRNAG